MASLRSGFVSRRPLFIDDFKLHVETLFVAFILWISSSSISICISIRNSKPWFLILALWFLRNIYLLTLQQFLSWINNSFESGKLNSVFIMLIPFYIQMILIFNILMVSIEVSYKKKVYRQNLVACLILPATSLSWKIAILGVARLKTANVN